MNILCILSNNIYLSSFNFANNINNSNNNNSTFNQLINNVFNFKSISKNKVGKSYNVNRLIITGRIINIIYHHNNYYNLIISFYNYSVNTQVMGFITNNLYVNNIHIGSSCYIINRGKNVNYRISDILFVTDPDNFLNKNSLEVGDSFFQVTIENIVINNKTFKATFNRVKANRGSNNDKEVYKSIKSSLLGSKIVIIIMLIYNI
jgi:hypothetical protein